MNIMGQARQAMEKLLDSAQVPPGGIVVVGCSTSEVAGERIGSAGSLEVAESILEGIMPAILGNRLYLAVQCCEHLNRALVLESEYAEAHGLEQVCVAPAIRAGGALATAFFSRLKAPVVVERLAANAGMDIGNTLIGMHLKPVAVPLRFNELTHIGCAHLVMAYTRPRFIGGERAVYPALTLHKGEVH